MTTGDDKQPTTWLASESAAAAPIIDTDTVEELRRLRNGLAGTLALLVVSAVAVSAVAVVTMHRSPERAALILGLGMLVDFATIVAAVVTVRRVQRRMAEIMSKIGKL